MSRIRNPVRYRHIKAAAILISLLPGLLTSQPARAYWELTPRIEGGITTETNPYNRIETQSYDGATGAFADFRLEGSLQTPRDVVTLTPRLRSSRFAGSNEPLDDDDYWINLDATHYWDTANANLGVMYRDNGIRTSEFNTANPGQTRDDSQSTWSFDPSLSYIFSARNSIQLTANWTDITYDAPPQSGYYDYTNGSIQATWIHAFSEKTSALVAVNGGSFKASDPYSASRNNTDSFGGTLALERKLSPTLTTTVTLGSSRSTQDVEGLFFDPENPGFLCPTYPFALCSISENSNNFVGGITLRQQSEVMTTTIDYSQSQAPRSNGTSVVSESFRVNFQRTLSRKLDGSFNLLYTSDSALGNYGRQDRAYFSGNAALRYRLTRTLAVNGSYNYSVNNDDANGAKQKNNSLFFSLIYTGVGIRR
ncbi:MAG: hypothetical protein H6979_03745 [Chromatiales bacterium]|nr:hypothetical protein [Chromatiales bacterium]